MAAPGHGTAAAAAAAAEDGEVEHLVKVVVVGAVSCGKSSLVHRYVNRTYSGRYLMTYGCDLSTKHLRNSSGRLVTLMLWDTAGHERVTNALTEQYFRNTSAALVVCAAAVEGSVDKALYWARYVDEKVGRDVPKFLVAARVDEPAMLDDFHLDMARFAKDNGFRGFIDTSAKTPRNVDEAFQMLVDSLTEEELASVPVAPSGTTLLTGARPPAQPQAESRKCCS